jgi:Cu-Zn family superoxide dismutase
MVGMTSVALLAVLGTGIAAPAAETPPPSPSDSKLSAVLKDVRGQSVGTVQIEDSGNGKTLVTVAVAGLTPGFHGFHIHSRGVCDPKSTDPATGSPFFNAGPHLGEGEHPNHTGDLPDLLVGDDGIAGASYVTDRFVVRQLLTRQGTSVIIHAKPDNKANIPTRYSHDGKTGPDAETLKAGDGGNRSACGVIGSR